MEIIEKRMDKLMPKFKTLRADFVTDYWNARNIVDVGGGHHPNGDTPTPAAAPAAPAK